MNRIFQSKTATAICMSVLSINLTHSIPVLAQVCGSDLDCPGDALCEDGQCVGANGHPNPPRRVPEGSGGSPTSSPGSSSSSVEFTSPNGAPTRVTDTGTGQTCMTPCKLNLPSGTRRLRINDGGSDIVVDVREGSDRFAISGPSPGVIVGAIFLGAGAPLALIGMIVRSSPCSTQPYDENYETDRESCSEYSGMAAVGFIAISIGLLTLALSDFGGVRRDAVASSGIHIAPLATITPSLEGGVAGWAGLRLAF